MSSQKVWDYWAKYYENLWVQKYSLKPTRRTVLSLIAKYIRKEDQSLLDVGCGTGQLLAEIHENGGIANPDLAGMDYSVKMLEQAKKKLPDTVFFLKDIEEIRTIEKIFDIVVCTHSLPYYKDQERAIGDMASLMESEGLLIIGCGSINSLYDRIAFALVKLTTGRAEYPSVHRLKRMAEKEFELLEIVRLRERWFMPSIIVAAFRKRDRR